MPEPEERASDDIRTSLESDVRKREQTLREVMEAGSEVYREEKLRMEGKSVAEETKKTSELNPTEAEVTQRIEKAAEEGHRKGLEEIIKIRNLSFPDLGSVHLQGVFNNPFLRRQEPSAPQIVTYKDAEGKEHSYFIHFNRTIPVSSSAELALADAVEEKSEQIPMQGLVEVDDNTVRILIDSAIAEIERTRNISQRDEEEIQRLKVETRDILRKLAA
jgi:hypothetical protein